MKYVEYRLVNSNWELRQEIDAKSRRQVMKQLVKADPVTENGEKTIVQRKVRKE